MFGSLQGVKGERGMKGDIGRPGNMTSSSGDILQGPPGLPGLPGPQVINRSTFCVLTVFGCACVFIHECFSPAKLSVQFKRLWLSSVFLFVGQVLSQNLK